MSRKRKTDKYKSGIKKIDKISNYWKFHDSYGSNRVGFGTVITRSQTAFNRIKNSDSELDIFSDVRFHWPPNKPHILVILKGEYGCIPRTIITRSTMNYLKTSEELCKEVDAYKDQELKQQLIEELKDFQRKSMTVIPAHDEQQPIKEPEGKVPEEPDLYRKLIEELKEYQRKNMTVTPAYDEQQPAKVEDEPMEESQAEDEPMEESDTEDDDSMTKEKRLQQINEADDYYSKRKQSIDQEGNPLDKPRPEEGYQNL